jgi:hypothetical protein
VLKNRTFALGFGASLLALSAVAASLGGLKSPHGSVVLSTDFAHKPVPIWSNGAFLSHDGPEVSLPALHVFDRTGKQLASVPFQIPGAVSVHLVGMARSLQGNLAVSGTAKNADGAGSNFIGLVGSSGAIKVIRTTPFAVSKLAFVPDGTLWALGQELDRDAHSWAEQPHSPILRHYREDGLLLGSALSPEILGAPYPADGAFLCVLGNRIGVFSPGGGNSTSQWMEISPSGDVRGVWRVPAFPESTTITGVAMTRAGVYASVQPAGPGRPRANIYRLEKSASNWMLLDSSAVATAEGSALILGSDNDWLVVAAWFPRVVWTQE